MRERMTRRGLFGLTAAAGGAGLARWDAPGDAVPFGPVTVPPGDPRYEELTTRAYNGRYTGQPARVRLVGTPEQVADAVGEAVRDGLRIGVRSGGHGFADVPDHPDVRVLIDVSQMNAIGYDPERKAFVVESGATLGQVYRTLFLGWGVTLPGGTCPDVGIGGHVAGGGYGALSHRYGAIVDHLEAVEVVVVGASGRPRTVIASRDPGDPNHDLWWAHTGGGGGTFGVVTRYWFRSPGARGAPATLLPKPPASLRQAMVAWRWDDVDEVGFARLLTNYTDWHAARPDADLHAGLSLLHRATGEIRLDVQTSGDDPGAVAFVDDYVAAIGAGVGAEPAVQAFTWPWLRATTSSYPGLSRYRMKSKSAMLRRPWTAGQIATIHRFLQRGGPEFYGAGAYLSKFGGRIGRVPADATAMPHRDARLSSFFETAWLDEAEDATQLAWVRDLYREVHADSGGAPVPGEAYSGAFANYLDTDLADEALNTSGTPWHEFYYRDNYPRLQRVKARWDPRDVFRHRMSVRPA
ncbi:FAD-binding oxidoreductase [Micromonospora aurantiaca (nom. illeg.)]|uniref:FAD-binding oxidoreductase n=1 Tax=Micromonospora aurantiaca (nom. illeg.) TaxID=47850 RepID=UPI003EB6F20D